jgi:hypothetical protein
MQAVDYTHIVALMQEIAVIKAAPAVAVVERGECQDYRPMLEIGKTAGTGPKGRRQGAFLRLRHHRHPGRHPSARATVLADGALLDPV